MQIVEINYMMEEVEIKSGRVIASQVKHTILESWPALKQDVESFLSDSDAWIISELKRAHQAKDWKNIDKIREVMESVHDMGHQH